MASPLLPYANTRLRVETTGAVSVVNGVPTQAVGTIYLIKCYLKRIQYKGVSSGSRKIPLPAELGGLMMPGAAGDQFYYRGYALQKATIASTFAWETDNLRSVKFTQITSQESFLLPGSELLMKLGNDKTMLGKIERSSGVFGGLGIDNIIYPGIGGVEIQLKGGEVQN
jgi:hypothetical protein